MSDVSLQAPPRLFPASRRRFGIAALALLGLAALLGSVIGHQPLLALLAVALAGVVLATPFVETLAVLTFWLLPYLILNLPTGGLTLKVPEVTAYLFATAAIARALLRREKILLPPATPQVLLLLAAFALSTAVSAPIPPVFGDYITGFQGPDLRSLALLFWLSLSWLVVISLHHIIGADPALYWKSLRAHILTGGFASLVGIIGYALALRGEEEVLRGIGHSHSFVFVGGSLYRLTGVSYEPVLFAFYLVTVIPVTFTAVLYRPAWISYRWAVFALILQVTALLLTFSAGGWTALVIDALLMAVLLGPQLTDPGRRRRLFQALLVPIGIGIVAFFAVPMVHSAMSDAIGKITGGGYKERNDEIVTGMRMFNDHFWLGVGPGMVPFYFPQYHPTSYSMTNRDGNLIANLYVTTLAENGIVGLLALLACGVAGLRSLAATIQSRGPAQVPYLTAMSISLFGCAVQYWEFNSLFLIYFIALIGLTMAGRHLAMQREEVPA